MRSGRCQLLSSHDHFLTLLPTSKFRHATSRPSTEIRRIMAHPTCSDRATALSWSSVAEIKEKCHMHAPQRRRVWKARASMRDVHGGMRLKSPTYASELPLNRVVNRNSQRRSSCNVAFYSLQRRGLLMQGCNRHTHTCWASWRRFNL